MSRRYLAAVVQLQVRDDKQANLRTAERLVDEAADAGAQLIALPEMFNLYGRFEPIVAGAEAVPGPTSQRLAEWAVRNEVFLVGGSFAQREEQTGRALNTSLFISPTGELVGRYSKIHLFDIDLPGRVSSMESNWITPGSEVAVNDSSLGKIGQAICYDLRFPELFRKLSARGAEVIVVPSAFTHTTGRDHWEVLVRARAIENQCYVLAPNQCGEPATGMKTYGHSMIVDAWGQVLAQLGEEEGFVCADIDLDQLANVRAQLPALAHRRL